MKVLENIAADLEQRIAGASIANSNRTTILFCGCDPKLKKICINAQNALVLLLLTQSNTLLLKLNCKILGIEK